MKITDKYLEESSFRMKIGGKTLQTLIHELDSRSVHVTPGAIDLMKPDVFTPISHETEARFVAISPSDFGFIQSPSTDSFPVQERIYDWSKRSLSKYEIGLCLPEVGPLFRIMKENQIHNETLWIAMAPIVDLKGKSRIFRIGKHNNRRWIDAPEVGSGNRWDLKQKIIFCLKETNKPDGRISFESILQEG